MDDDSTPGPADAADRRLSYKFQRLRERIRAAIEGGELAGKLPGERVLAKHFNVNAKTLSKALTDLAAEGVLQRNIGLGTFVRDAATPTPALNALLIADLRYGNVLADALIGRGLLVSTHSPAADLPPSLLAPFDVVLVGSPDVADDTVRNLLVRGKDVITLGRLSNPFSTHALLPHGPRAAMQAAAELSRLGHRRLLVVGDDPDVTHAVAASLPHAEVRACQPADAVAAARGGFTAAVSDADCTAELLAHCRDAGLSVPDLFSVIGFGHVRGPQLSDGYHVTDGMLADRIADLLAAGLPHRPVTLWLPGERHVVGTAGVANTAS